MSSRRDATELNAFEPSENAAALTPECIPALRQHVAVNTELFRQELWWVLAHRETGASYRLDEHAYRIVQRLDGKRDIARIIEELAGVAEAEDVLSLLSQLHSAELIQLAGSPLQVANERGGKKSSQSFSNPLAIRLPLCDPDRLLERLQPYFSKLYTRTSLWAAISLIALAVLTVLQGFPELAAYTAARAENLSSLFLLLLVYPVVKSIHELAHALTIKHYGGEVHEMGIMLLVFFPVPYVDASASAAFPNKEQRIAVAAAGIVAELLLAASAIMAWVVLDAGLWSDLALAVALIGGISTLVFNGNPLLRFDGYFVLSDALEIPNLASRARQYCLYLIKRSIGVKNISKPITAPGEAPWLIAYFWLAGAYRLVVLFGIALFLVNTIPLLGALLAAFAIYKQLGVPTYRAAHYLIAGAELDGQRRLPIGVFGSLVACTLAIVLFVPVPHWHAFPGLVRMPETSTIRASESGFITRVNVKENTIVKPDDVIAVIHNDELTKEKQRLEWRLRELQAQKAQVVFDSPNEALQIATSINSAQTQLADVSARLEKLIIRAPGGGQLQFAGHTDWLGQFIEEGAELAFIVNDSDRTIISAAPESAIVDIRRPDTRVFVRSATQPERTIPATLSRLTPASTKELESSALGSRYGGVVTVDSRDSDGKHALEKVFHLELTPVGANDLLPGSSAMLRFEHASSSLATQLTAALVRFLMREINW